MNLFGFLLCALLFLNTTLRLFTNHLHVLPRIFNTIDLMFAGVFVLLFVGRKHGMARERGLYGRLVAFNLVLVLGALLNMEYLYPPATISQIIMWNEPIILFLILVNLPFSRQDFAAFNRSLFFLIMFEFAIGLMQVLVYFRTGESEAIIGTFQGNAEQYGAFLMIGLLYLMGQAHVEPATRMRNGIVVVGMLILMMLIDNKASWLGIALSGFYVLHRLGITNAEARHWMKYVFVFVALFGLAFLVVLKSSGTLHKYAAIKQAWETGNFLNLGKIKAYRDVMRAYDLRLHMALVGSGPGTFYSRASSQFYELSDDMFIIPFATLAGENDSHQASDSMKGIIQKTDFEPFFKTFFMDSRIFFIGSGTADDPFFSFVALLGEAGILGTLIYLGIYVAVFKRLSCYFNRFQKDGMVFPMIVSALGFIVYLMVISKYNNWLETGRLTTTLWSMIAMVCKYAELCDARAVTHEERRQYSKGQPCRCI